MKKIKTGVRGGLCKEFIVDDETYEWLNSAAWICQKIGGRYYAFFNRYIPQYKRERVMMHRLIMNCPDGDVDHINRDTLDNRISNLRVCTRSENFLNTGPRPGTASGLKWVSWNKRDGRWRVSIKRHGALHYGGSFTSKRAAAIAANRLGRKIHGEYAYQNPIP